MTIHSRTSYDVYSRPSRLSLSNFHHFVAPGLKSAIIIEQAGLFEKNKLKSVQKLSNSSRLGDLYDHEKKHFSPLTLISKTKHSFKLRKSSLLMTERCSLQQIQTTPHFLFLEWPAHKKLYPSIVILLSDESIDWSKNVSDRKIKS